MIIKNLSIVAGGGVFVTNDQADQETGAHVLIGLGGTGIDCLKNVKKQVFNRLKPDDVTSPIKEYNHIRFLALDTDRSSLGGDESISAIDPVNEFIDISCNDIHSLIRRPDLLYQNPSQRWLSDRITIQNAQAGAGGVRQIGRLLVMQNVSKIVSKIQSTITQAMTELSATDPINIHIFTGMGGGTGSGTFLDICYILQYVLDKNSILGRAQTCGYFFLPDVNKAKVNNAAVNDYIEINGFAAMKELDYCMNFCNNGGEWNQSYDSFEVNTNAQPVKLAHLITAKDEGGAIKKNGYDYAMNVVTDYVLEFMTKQNVGEQERADGNFGLASHIGNFDRIVEMLRKKRGARYYYCVLGASNAYIPYKDINTYLAAKIFKEYDLLPKANHDVEDFVATKGFSYEEIIRSIEEDIPSIPTFSVDKNMLYEQVQGLTSDNIPKVLTRMRDSYSEINGKLTTNRESLCVALIESVKTELSSLAKTPGRGPVYASLLLRNPSKTDKDLIDITEGYITQNETNLRIARGDFKLREDDMGSALNKLQNSNKINRKSRAEEYVSSVWTYYTQYVKISKYVEMAEVLRVFKDQLTTLYDNNYSHLIKALNDISETFDANFKALDDTVDKNDDYAIKIVSLKQKEFKKSLDEDAKNMDRAGMVLRLVSTLVDTSEQWMGNDDGSKLANIVSSFFARELKNVNAGIDSYLRRKYKVDGEQNLATEIYNDLMMKLKDKANPLFWVDSVDGSIDPKSKTGYCSVPSVSQVIKAAGNKLNEVNQEISVRVSQMRDRIALLVFYCGVPMFQFKGSFDYKPAYQGAYVVGAHLYEGAKENDDSRKDRRDFRKLHDIIPFSLLKREGDKALEDFHSIFKKALEVQIVYPRPIGTDGRAVEYVLQMIDRDDLKAKKERIIRLKRDQNEKRMIDFIDNTENIKLVFNNSLILPNTGYGEYKESSVEDHIFASEYLTAKLQEQLLLVKDYINDVDSMNKDLEYIRKIRALVKTFGEALCTDVIHQGNNRYEFMYTHDDGVSTSDILLSNIDYEPYGQSMPLYSAFKEFVKLSDEEMNELSEMIRDRLLNQEKLCVEASSKTRDYLNNKIDGIVSNAQAEFPSEAQEIKRIMIMIKGAVDNFIKSLS